MAEVAQEARNPSPVAVALGSNLGDRLGALRFAAAQLSRILCGMRCSSLYETEPRYVEEQALFLNACCVGRTVLPPEALLARLKRLERVAGRTEEAVRFGPRALDLDLLLYDDLVVEGPDLTIPHLRMTERAFVLVPLGEIAAEWRVPGTGMRAGGGATVGELRDRIPSEGVRRWDGADGEGGRREAWFDSEAPG